MSEVLDHDIFGQPRQEELTFYRDFFKAEQAEAFADLMRQHGVPFSLEKNKMLMDGYITGHGLLSYAVLKLRPQDFTKVNALLEAQALADASFYDHHYLHEFEAKELLDVPKKPDEWTPEDVAVAHRILEKRGIPIPAGEAAEYRQQRTEHLQTGRSGNPLWIAVYAGCILVGSLWLNLFFLVGGIGMGWYYWQDKTHDADGRRFFTFDPTTRRVGRLLFFMGWLLPLAGLAVRELI